MPVISMFHGIIIVMYFFDDERHHLAHVHARFQGDEASLSIVDAEVLAGSLPRAKLRLVQAWIELHRDELLADWELAASGEPLSRIDPLR